MSEASIHEIKEVLGYGIAETDEAQAHLMAASQDAEQTEASVRSLREAVQAPAKFTAKVGKVAGILSNSVRFLEGRGKDIAERAEDAINGGRYNGRSLNANAAEAQTIAGDLNVARNRILAVASTKPKDEGEAKFLEEVAATSETANAAVTEAEILPQLVNQVRVRLEELAAANTATSQLWKDQLAGNIAKVLAIAERIEGRTSVIGTLCDELADAASQYRASLGDAARSNATVKEAAESYKNSL